MCAGIGCEGLLGCVLGVGPGLLIKFLREGAHYTFAISEFGCWPRICLNVAIFKGVRDPMAGLWGLWCVFFPTCVAW